MPMELCRVYCTPAPQAERGPGSGNGVSDHTVRPWLSSAKIQASASPSGAGPPTPQACRPFTERAMLRQGGACYRQTKEALLSSPPDLSTLPTSHSWCLSNCKPSFQMILRNSRQGSSERSQSSCRVPQLISAEATLLPRDPYFSWDNSASLSGQTLPLCSRSASPPVCRAPHRDVCLVSKVDELRP